MTKLNNNRIRRAHFAFILMGVISLFFIFLGIKRFTDFYPEFQDPDTGFKNYVVEYGYKADNNTRIEYDSTLKYEFYYALKALVFGILNLILVVIGLAKGKIKWLLIFGLIFLIEFLVLLFCLS